MAESKYEKTKQYNKLVRDKIPAHIKSLGKSSKHHIASEEEYCLKLKEKLLEEAQEFTEEETESEIADILEVIDAICKFKKFDKKQIVKIKKEKAKARGKFNKRIILEES